MSFKDLNVSYYTNTIYNDSLENIDCVMDNNFNQPVLDNAKNYVCAIERLEVSSNAIPFYDVDNDPDSLTQILLVYGTYQSSKIYFCTNNTNIGFAATFWELRGIYYSLQHIIDDLNAYDLREHGYPDAVTGEIQPLVVWYLDGGGCINAQITRSRFFGAMSVAQNFQNSGFVFDSNILASIFGLPRIPTTLLAYHNLYSQHDLTNTYLHFKTKYSRIDAGRIPGIIQIRTNLPFESDQVNSAKFNIATDFNIIQGTSTSTGYNLKNQTITRATTLTFNSLVPVGSSTAWSFNTGGMIIYNPNERRWLNFSTPIPIYSIRLWVEYVTFDGTITQLLLPPGCKFSIKLGFYMKEIL